MVQDLQPNGDGYRHYLATTQEGTTCSSHIHAQAQARHGQCGPDGVCLEEGEIHSTVTGQSDWKTSWKATCQDSRTEEAIDGFGHWEWLYDKSCIRTCIVYQSLYQILCSHLTLVIWSLRCFRDHQPSQLPLQDLRYQNSNR